MATLDEVLTKTKRQKNDGSKIRVGFTARGEDAKVLKAALSKVGIDGDMPNYIRRLVLADLKAKLTATEKAGK